MAEDKTVTDTFKIRIKNFQSLSEAEIELEDGLTIVTGATNNGKSAIIRAVESAVFNDGTDEYIKAGTDGLSVELDNGAHNVVYVRKVKGKTDKTTYRFDGGEPQQKVGRAQLPEMGQLFNIREVRLQNNQKARLNFWYQNDKPFLMDKTAGQLYEFLSVSSSEKYLAVLKAMAVDMKQEETGIKALTVSIDTLKKELGHKQDVLDRNRGFQDLYERLSVLKETGERLRNTETILAAMDEVQKLSGTVNESLRRATAHLEMVPMEHVLLEMERFTGNSGKMDLLEKLEVEASRASGRLGVAEKKLQKAKALAAGSEERMSGMRERIDATGKLQEEVSVLAIKEEAFCSSGAKVKACRIRLKALPATAPTEALASVQNCIVSIEKDMEWLAGRRNQTTEVMAAAAKMKTAQDALKSLLRRLESSDVELDTLKREMGVCPFCGAVFGNGNNSCSHLFQ